MRWEMDDWERESPSLIRLWTNYVSDGTCRGSCGDSYERRVLLCCNLHLYCKGGRIAFTLTTVPKRAIFSPSAGPL